MPGGSMHVRSEAVRARLHAASCKRREIISPSVLQQLAPHDAAYTATRPVVWGALPHTRERHGAAEQEAAPAWVLALLLRDTHSLAAATRGLRVLTAHTEAPVVTETTMIPGVRSLRVSSRNPVRMRWLDERARAMKDE
eukprot:765979-Rhodomonas_salina.3